MTRNDRPSRGTPPKRIRSRTTRRSYRPMDRANTPWYEDPDTVLDKLRWGRRKKRMLDWVRSQMILRLTKVERECIELYYFRGLTYRESADVLGVTSSSVCRAVKRGLRKLRAAAKARGNAKF